MNYLKHNKIPKTQPNTCLQIWNTWEARAFASTCKLENLKIVRNGHQNTKTTEDEEVFWINASPIKKHSNKDLDTTTHLKNRGRSIKVSSIPWFVIMIFNCGYVYITNCKLKAYVYILEIVLTIFWETPFFPKCMSLDVWYWIAGWNAHRTGILESINENLTNTPHQHLHLK